MKRIGWVVRVDPKASGIGVQDRLRFFSLGFWVWGLEFRVRVRV